MIFLGHSFFLCFVLVASFSAQGSNILVRDAALLATNCQPVKWIVINSHEIQIYDESHHGRDRTLRLFDKLPSDCPGNIVSLKAAKQRKLSRRTDVQVRDPRTGLSTFIYRRGFLTWARSLLKWIPFASTAVGIFDLIDCAVEWNSNSWAGKTACVLGGIFTTIGASGEVFSTIAAALSSGASTAADLLRWSNEGFDLSTIYNIIPRNMNSSSSTEPSMVFPGFRHIHDGSNVTLVHLARSNESHPLKLVHHSKALNKPVPVKLWPSWNNATSTPRLNVMMPLSWFSTNSSKLRARCSSGWDYYNDGQIDICEYPETVSTGSAATIPREIYYGVDLYGTKDEIIEYEDNLGVTYSDSNGEGSAYVAMAEDIANDNAWDTCVCMQDGGNWIATGSLQMSWDGTYNGYSPCWNPNCDNAANLGK